MIYANCKISKNGTFFRFMVTAFLLVAVYFCIGQTRKTEWSRIRNYQLVVGGLQMMNLPVSYILLRMGMFPEVVIVVAIAISQCCLAARLLMLRGMIGLSVRKYLKKVYINVLIVTVIASIFPFLMTYVLTESFLNFILSSLAALICTGITIYYVGCNKAERQFVLNKLYTLKNKLNKR